MWGGCHCAKLCRHIGPLITACVLWAVKDQLTMGLWWSDYIVCLPLCCGSHLIMASLSSHSWGGQGAGRRGVKDRSAHVHLVKRVRASDTRCMFYPAPLCRCRSPMLVRKQQRSEKNPLVKVLHPSDETHIENNSSLIMSISTCYPLMTDKLVLYASRSQWTIFRGFVCLSHTVYSLTSNMSPHKTQAVILLVRVFHLFCCPQGLFTCRRPESARMWLVKLKTETKMLCLTYRCPITYNADIHIKFCL